jgi:hypothetical protein
VWTWTAIDADTKLIPSFHVESRDAVDANIFMRDAAERLTNRVQLTSDGHKSYLGAVERAFGDGISTTPCWRSTTGRPRKATSAVTASFYVRIHTTLRVTPAVALASLRRYGPWQTWSRCGPALRSTPAGTHGTSTTTARH